MSDHETEFAEKMDRADKVLENARLAVKNNLHTVESSLGLRYSLEKAVNRLEELVNAINHESGRESGQTQDAREPEND